MREEIDSRMFYNEEFFKQQDFQQTQISDLIGQNLNQFYLNVFILSIESNKFMTQHKSGLFYLMLLANYKITRMR